MSSPTPSLKKSVIAEEAAASVYERLCAKIDIAPMSGSVDFNGFSDAKRMAESAFRYYFKAWWKTS